MRGDAWHVKRVCQKSIDARSFAPKCKNPFFYSHSLIDSEYRPGRDRLGLQRQFGFACWVSHGMHAEKPLRTQNARGSSITLHTCELNRAQQQIWTSLVTRLEFL
jgi:hypothetical protein